jgi:hypothetical protein
MASAVTALAAATQPQPQQPNNNGEAKQTTNNNNKNNDKIKKKQQATSKGAARPTRFKLGEKVTRSIRELFTQQGNRYHRCHDDDNYKRCRLTQTHTHTHTFHAWLAHWWDAMCLQSSLAIIIFGVCFPSPCSLFFI